MDTDPLWCCPITRERMCDPVLAADGHTYERYAIEGWLRGHGSSPVTRQQLANKTLVPNRALREVIERALGPAPEPEPVTIPLLAPRPRTQLDDLAKVLHNRVAAIPGVRDVRVTELKNGLFKVCWYKGDAAYGVSCHPQHAGDPRTIAEICDVIEERRRWECAVM